MDRTTHTDEYYATAIQIFDHCGVNTSGTLRVDSLMDKFAPFVKTNKSEYSYLKSLLDPDESNPEINVTKLAEALSTYSENQRCKIDLEESFNLRNGQLTQDSDSGISTDGIQILEELQCELREKTHMAHKLRSQLDFSDRQHEEALASITAERDSLRAHLNMLREENLSLCDVRRDYEEVCERLMASEEALQESRRELERATRNARTLNEQVDALETQKSELEQLLCKSKAECHRMNEMYAGRQSALLELGEVLGAERAELAARLADTDKLLQNLIKDKVQLEIKLKNIQNQSRMEQSIDVSYTEEQMLNALDSLNADSKFSQDHHLLSEELFLKALKGDQGRASNISLFDEIRLSFSESDAKELGGNFNKCMEFKQVLETPTNTATQTESNENDSYDNSFNVEFCKEMSPVVVTDQSEHIESPKQNILYGNEIDFFGDSSQQCSECERLILSNDKIKQELRDSKSALSQMESELLKYEENLNVLQKTLDEGNESNNVLHTLLDNLQTKLVIMEAACESQRMNLASLSVDTFSTECQTTIDYTSVSTQVDVPCGECIKRTARRSRSLRRYLWESAKCLFQLFAVVCFACAVCALYGVTRRSYARCAAPSSPPATLPWRWFDVNDIIDLLLSVDYVAEVPM